MSPRTLLVCLPRALGLTLLVACGGSEPGTGTTPTSAGESVSTTALSMEYAEFELLKQKAPEEATRLGIE
jgi:hypothetical protein